MTGIGTLTLGSIFGMFCPPRLVVVRTEADVYWLVDLYSTWRSTVLDDQNELFVGDYWEFNTPDAAIVAGVMLSGELK